MQGTRPTRFSVVRYGNVIGSRGSVVPLFLEQRASGVLNITDRRMTRFWMTLQQAVELVLGAADLMQGGEIFVPKIPSARVMDVAAAIGPHCRFVMSGIRPGEKLHEVLIAPDEAAQTIDAGQYYVVAPIAPTWAFRRVLAGDRNVAEDFQYSSADNPQPFTPRGGHMRVAVIGRGSIGSRHAKNALELGHEVLSYDTAPRAQWVEEREHRASSLEEIVDYRPDAVMICTPASTHATVARQLLEGAYSGPLFVEKPIATTREACAVFRHWPAPVTVGYNWRFNREVQRFFDEVRGRALAYLYFICETDMSTWAGTGYADPLLECSHEIDLAMAWDSELRLAHAGARGSSAVMLYLKSAEHHALIDVHWRVAPGRRRFMACTSDDVVLEFEPTVESIEQSYVDELQAFLAGARDGCWVEEAITVVELVGRAKAREFV
jgi:hypothetical protein